MSLFSFSRLITLAKKVDKSLFETILTPSDLDSVTRAVSDMKPAFKSLLTRYVPRIHSIPLNQGNKFVPTWKSVPMASWYTKLLRRSGDGQSLKSVDLSLPSLCYEMAAFL